MGWECANNFDSARHD